MKRENRIGWRNKKGISPLIATVIMIGLVISLAALMVNWQGQFTEKTIAISQKMIDSSEIRNINVRNIVVTDYSEVSALIENEDSKEIDKLLVVVEGELGRDTTIIDGLNGFESRNINVSYNLEITGENISKVNVIPISEGVKEELLIHRLSEEVSLDITEEVTDKCLNDLDNDGVNDCLDSDDDNDGCKDLEDYNATKFCPRFSCSLSIIGEGCNEICEPFMAEGSHDECTCVQGSSVSCLASQECVDYTCVESEAKCELLEAYWNKDNVQAGESVELVIEGRNCENITLSLDYNEIDLIGKDKVIGLGLPNEVDFDEEGLIARTNWNVSFIDDNDGWDNTGELMFTASYNPSIDSGILNVGGGEGALTVSGEYEYIWIEAEDANIVAPMAIDNDVDASNGQFVRTPTLQQGSVSFIFDAPVTDDYYIWGRVYAPNDNQDSFFTQMDSGPIQEWNLAYYEAYGCDPNPQEWWWDAVSTGDNGEDCIPIVDPLIFSGLTENIHTFTISGIEAYTGIDKILITNDPDYVPEDMGGITCYPPIGVDWTISTNIVCSNDIIRVGGNFDIKITPTGSLTLENINLILESLSDGGSGIENNGKLHINNSNVTSDTDVIGGAHKIYFWNEIGSELVINNSVIENVGYNFVDDNKKGIHIKSGDNIIENVSITGGYRGVIISNSNNNLVVNTLFEGLVDDGVYISGGGSNELINNSFIDGGKRGIAIFNSNNNLVVNTLFEGLVDDGVYISGGGSNELINNSFIDGGKRGIGIYNSDNNLIANSTFYELNDDGVFISNGDFNEIIGNNLTSSLNGDGIQMEGTNLNNKILNNNITYNRYRGINSDSNNDFLEISNNVIIGKSGTHAGMRLIDNDNLFINNNTIINFNGGTWSGIYMDGSNGEITENVFYNNNRGLHIIGGSGNNFVYKNNFTENNHAEDPGTLVGIGLVIDSNSNNNISENYFDRNGEDGGIGKSSIFLVNSLNNIFTNNNVSSNGPYHIYFDSTNAANATFVNTTFDKDKVNINHQHSSLEVKWWMEINVTDVNAEPIQDALVKVYDTHGAKVYEHLTDENGFTELRNFTEYLQTTNVDKWNDEPYDIYVSYSGYDTVSLIDESLTESRIINVELSGACGYNEGNWNINEKVICRDANISLDTGASININDGGWLIISNVSIVMDTTNNNGQGIFVNFGGNLSANESSEFDSIRTKYSFKSNPGSKLYIENSTIRDVETYNLVNYLTRGLLLSSGNATLKNNTFEENYIAISVNSNNNTIIGNKIKGASSGFGVILFNANNNSIKNNEVYNINSGQNARGILIMNSENNTFNGNYIHHISGAGGSQSTAFGILSTNSRNNIYVNNIINDNGILSGKEKAGINIQTSNNTLLYNNTFTNNNFVSLKIENSDKVVIYANEFKSASAIAGSGRNLNITNNSITGTTNKVGIEVSSFNGSIVGNYIGFFTGFDGIGLSFGGEYSEIKRNRISYVGKIGLELYGSNNLIEGNLIESSGINDEYYGGIILGKVGISNINVENNTILNNRILNNRHGVMIEDNINNTWIIDSIISGSNSNWDITAGNEDPSPPKGELIVLNSTGNFAWDNEFGSYNHIHIIRKNYLDINVTNITEDVLENANITWWNNNSNEVWYNDYSNEDGLILGYNITSHIENRSGTFRFDNYTFNASLEGYLNYTNSFIITANSMINISMELVNKGICGYFGGDWIIEEGEDVVCSDVELDIDDDSSVIIKGTLTLDNLNLTINPVSGDGYAWINNTGSLYINHTNITSGNENFNYLIQSWENGNFVLENSFIKDVGFDSTEEPKTGIFIASNHSIINNNSIISDVRRGLVISSENWITEDVSIFNNYILAKTDGIHIGNGVKGGVGIRNKIENNTLITTLFGFSSIYMDRDSDYNNISYNNVTSESHGIYFVQNSYNLILNNSIYAEYGSGIRLTSSHNNSVINNGINSNAYTGADRYAILLYNSGDNIFYNNNISGTNSQPTVKFSSSNNNIFIKNVLSSELGYLISSGIGYNYNKFIDTISDNGNMDVQYIKSSILLLNTTFNREDITFDTVNYAESNVTVQWWFNFSVTDKYDGQPIKDVNITAFNSIDDPQFEVFTSDMGTNDTQNVTEAVYYGTGSGTERIEYNNYNIIVSKDGYITQNIEYNFSNSSSLDIKLVGDKQPNITNIELTNDVEGAENWRSCNLEDDNDGDGQEDLCYVYPEPANNVTNLNFRITTIDSSLEASGGNCDDGTREAYVHLCLINVSRAVEDINLDCNETVANYTYKMNNIVGIEYDGEYGCSYSLADNLVASDGTPAFYIAPGDYMIHVNVTNLYGEREIDDEKNTNWTYVGLAAVEYWDTYNDIEATQVKLGGDNIVLGQVSSGDRKYTMTNIGNIHLALEWNASNPEHVNPVGAGCNIGVNDKWDLQGDDMFVDDDDSYTNEPPFSIPMIPLIDVADSGEYLNYTYGLRVCKGYEMCDYLNDNKMDTYYHIIPPVGLCAGTYNNLITYTFYDVYSGTKIIKYMRQLDL